MSCLKDHRKFHYLKDMADFELKELKFNLTQKLLGQPPAKFVKQVDILWISINWGGVFSKFQQWRKAAFLSEFSQFIWVYDSKVTSKHIPFTVDHYYRHQIRIARVHRHISLWSRVIWRSCLMFHVQFNIVFHI